jgi:hypothetical protein
MNQLPLSLHYEFKKITEKCVFLQTTSPLNPLSMLERGLKNTRNELLSPLSMMKGVGGMRSNN